MKQKIIRGSKRGLTFSFPSKGRLSIGSNFTYEIDKTAGSITIKPAKEGKHTISRKRAGEGWNALVDLRSKEVRDAIAGMNRIALELTEDTILIRSADKAKILAFPRQDLLGLRLAAGMDNVQAVDALLEGTQITLDDYLASCCVSIPTIQRDLADVYTVVSLFSGAGILDYPFSKDNRISLRYAIDYEPSAVETYRKNIGLHAFCGDVHKAFTADGYPMDSTVRDPDIIIGGPSCKPFSSANRHTRLADHPDSDLLNQYMRIVSILRPKVFAIENVPEVLTACGGAYYSAIREAASEAGYEMDARVVQDNLLGGYTTRRRAVILGSRIGHVSFPELHMAKGTKTVADALGPIDPSWPNYGDVTMPGPGTKKRMSFVPQGGNYKDIPPEYQTGSKNRHSCTYRRLALNAPSPTIVNWRKPPLVHPTEDRTLTVAEAKALQGLPKEFTICGTLSQKQQQVGNSVPVAIGRYIKDLLLRLLNAGKTPLTAPTT